jgi:hypothetical protein
MPVCPITCGWVDANSKFGLALPKSSSSESSEEHKSFGVQIINLTSSTHCQHLMDD